MGGGQREKDTESRRLPTEYEVQCTALFHDPEIMPPTQNQPSVASLTESLRGPKKEIFLKNINDIIQI